MQRNHFEPRRPRLVQLKQCFADPLLEVMNVLNEVVLDHPKALSFAPDRPLETYFHVEESLAAVHHFVNHAAQTSGRDEQSIWQKLDQYNHTNDIINKLISQQLAEDEGIQVSPEAIMVTVRAQE